LIILQCVSSLESLAKLHTRSHNRLWYLVLQVGLIEVTRKYFGHPPFIGGLPYLGTSITTVYLARQAQLAASGAAVGIDPGVALTVLDQALNLQVTYGAVMLSFLGWLLPINNPSS
jgi:hypothetical protein